jgi:hypothetical protein
MNKIFVFSINTVGFKHCTDYTAQGLFQAFYDRFCNLLRILLEKKTNDSTTRCARFAANTNTTLLTLPLLPIITLWEREQLVVERAGIGEHALSTSELRQV